MADVTIRRLRKRIGARSRRWRHPVLARSLGRLSDAEIDEALKAAGLCREGLFIARNAIARHRTRMAHMLAMLGIDIADAVRDHWTALKDADQRCSLCPNVGRCRRWLEWGQVNDAPQVFCPNAGVFDAIGADQAKRQLGRYLV